MMSWLWNLFMVLKLDIIPNRSTGHLFIKAINNVFLFLPYILCFKVERGTDIQEHFRRLGTPISMCRGLLPMLHIIFFRLCFGRSLSRLAIEQRNVRAGRNPREGLGLEANSPCLFYKFSWRSKETCPMLH